MPSGILRSVGNDEIIPTSPNISQRFDKLNGGTISIIRPIKNFWRSISSPQKRRLFRKRLFKKMMIADF
jgi:hypothetical protein